MAPEGHWCAISATASGVAASGWIHSPCTLGTNTSGCDSTQPRECMHFFASKRMRTFMPSTISMALMRPDPLARRTHTTLPKNAQTRQTVAPFQPRNDRRSILAHLTHVTHSQMLETRRRRKRGKKDLAGAAKRAKKLAKWNARKARAAAKAPGAAVKTGEAGGPDLA